MNAATDDIAVKRHPVVTGLHRGLQAACGTTALGPMVLAVSGGGDSTALLLAMDRLRRRDGVDIDPHVVHVHHHLRAEADADAEFVRSQCAELGIGCDVLDVHPERGGAEARALRYDALLGTARRIGAAWVATAHHAEDQFETIIAALGRGAGPGGLSGMAACRELGDGVRLVRPLLTESRATLRSLCETAGVAWREDPTNVDPTTLRGRLRRDVLPVLEELWPGVARRVSDNADLVRAASESLDAAVDGHFGRETEWTRASLRPLDRGLRLAGLRRAILRAGVGADGIDGARLMDAADAISDGAEHGRTFLFTGGVRVKVDANRVWIEQENDDG